MKMFLAVLSLVAIPSLAFAGGCSGGHSASAASCADGFTWDAGAQACVQATT